ncbi:MAG: amidohydrolase family protein [Lachnospiraceae bacterium]
MNNYKIKNGKIYNPICKEWIKKTVYIENGKISEGNHQTSYENIDAEGCIVSPGFIDYHVHYFNHGSDNGVNGDAASFPCGVTTVVDGGSCGASTYEVFEHNTIVPSDVRIMSLLYVASGGQLTSQYVEDLNPENFDEQKITQLFEKYRHHLVGLKIRLSKNIVSPEVAHRALKRTIQIAEKLGTNVVVHITNPAMDLELLASELRVGDVICHIYQNKGDENIFDKDGKMRKGILDAQKRGVIMDSSNGVNNFHLKVAEAAVAQGFLPDVISTDLNTLSCFTQPLHSMPRVMSKYLTFGMPLEKVLNASILTPARLIGMESLASMAEGTEADIVIFKIKEKEIKYYDHTDTNCITGNQIIVPQMTLKGGTVMYSQCDFN